MVQLISLDDILVPSNRQRREFDQKKLVELANSIESKGLMHAVVLRRIEHPDRPSDFELIAGERRMRAMFILFEGKRTFLHNGVPVEPGRIPYVLVDQDLTEDMRVEAELEENILRVDLSTMERALAIKQLHDLRTGQKGAYDRSASQFLGEQVGHSVADTAREVHGDKVGSSGEQDIRDALLIAKHASDPEVAAARTTAEAIKVIRKTAESKQRIAKAQAFDPEKTPHKLLVGNTYELWKQPELAGFADVIITDPPYGIGVHEHNPTDGRNTHDYDDSEEAFALVLANLPQMCAAVGKEQCHVYVFCDYSRFNELFAAFEIAGFNCWLRPLIWDKGNVGSFGNIEVGFRKTYDCILFANRGKRKMQVGAQEVLSFNPTSTTAHAAEKPVDLYIELMRRSCSVGDSVVDFYAGSGTIFDAAAKCQVVAVGMEGNPAYAAIATNRLQLLTGQITDGDVKVDLSELL